MKTVVCFGDSNTYGYRPADGKRYSYEERWTGILNERLRHFGYVVAEEGLVGRTTVFDDSFRYGRNGAKTLPVVLETHNPSVVILMLGTNDCKAEFRASSKTIAGGIETLINQIKNYDPSITIVLASPIHLGEKVHEAQYDPEFDEHSVDVSKALKKEYLRIALKYNCSFIAASDYASPSIEDQEHLTAAGHRDLARAFYQTVTGDYGYRVAN